MADVDVTDRVEYADYLNGSFLPVTKCVCGKPAEGGYYNIPPAAVAPDDGEPMPRRMPCCGRRLWYRQTIVILEARP